MRRGFLPASARTRVRDATLTLLDGSAAETVLAAAAVGYGLLVGVTRRLTVSSFLPALFLDDAHGCCAGNVRKRTSHAGNIDPLIMRCGYVKIFSLEGVAFARL